tara:strand:- start:23 stop:931 length:909 start_codon:yes stop_codon:yes gene_type:complete
MYKLVGKKYNYKGLILGKVTVVTEPRTGFMLNKKNEVLSVKSCLVKCKCGSRHEVPFVNVSNHYSGICPVCKQKNMEKAPSNRVKSLFEYWIEQWEPETHRPCTFKLPFFKGGVGEEYISGFCYVSKETYDKCSKVMCIKPKHYMGYNLSKDNSSRLNVPYKGNKSGYKFIHRIAINSKTEATDHINGITTDNRPCNLREATVQSNNFNKNKLDSNTTGYTGIVIRKRPKPYFAQIMYYHKPYTKSFGTIEEAVLYRDVLTLAFFGEYGKLNVPDKEEYYKVNILHILTDKHKNQLKNLGLL